ncbi:DUF2378 family protein [Archangium violaceum]|uniref:TIGR02265 family protein n=1 Tax=Archangium violaceum TaxID=83451 RepID=UPI00193B2835|nr:TIGR02265 family protein [Archangium violaceum]QRK10318.1 DUF2378 family protein [Archangium violaceum]
MNSTSTAQSSQGPGSQQELEQRLAVVGPKDTTRGFLFIAALDFMKTEANAEALKRCMEAAGNTNFTAFFSYPVATLLKLTYAAARELSGKYNGFDGAMQQLGFRAAPRFLESTTGKMLLSLVGKDPKRLIDSMPSAYKAAWEHGGCTLTWNGPRSGRLTYVNAIPVAYFSGSVLQILSAAQLKNAQAIGRQTSLSESTVDFSWD